MNRLIVASLALALAASAIGQQILPPRGEIEQIVREYILQHPEVLMQAVQSYQERQRAARQQDASRVIAVRRGDLVDTSSPAAGKGPEKTPVVMFFDYRCGYCKRVDQTVLKLAEEDSGAYVIFKELPILGPESTIASSAALAADKQGAYLAFHKALMAMTEAVTLQSVEQIASNQQLDIEKFKTDMRSAEVAEALARNRELADALGVRATPSFVIGSELVSGALEPAVLRTLIDKATPAKQARN